MFYIIIKDMKKKQKVESWWLIRKRLIGRIQQLFSLEVGHHFLSRNILSLEICGFSFNFFSPSLCTQQLLSHPLFHHPILSNKSSNRNMYSSSSSSYSSLFFLMPVSSYYSHSIQISWCWKIIKPYGSLRAIKEWS